MLTLHFRECDLHTLLSVLLQDQTLSMAFRSMETYRETCYQWWDMKPPQRVVLQQDSICIRALRLLPILIRDLHANLNRTVLFGLLTMLWKTHITLRSRVQRLSLY